MPILHCSQKLLKELRVQSSDTTSTESDSRLGDWYVQTFRFGRRKGYLFASERTLYSFVIVRPGITTKNIVTVFKDMLALCLSSEEFAPDVIANVLGDYESMQIAGGNNRSVLGTMNQLRLYYDYEIDGSVPDGSLGHLAVTQKYNRIPWSNLGMKYPIDLVKEILT